MLRYISKCLGYVHITIHSTLSKKFHIANYMTTLPYYITYNIISTYTILSHHSNHFPTHTTPHSFPFIIFPTILHLLSFPYTIPYHSIPLPFHSLTYTYTISFHCYILLHNILTLPYTIQSLPFIYFHCKISIYTYYLHTLHILSYVPETIYI